MAVLRGPHSYSDEQGMVFRSKIWLLETASLEQRSPPPAQRWPKTRCCCNLLERDLEDVQCSHGSTNVNRLHTPVAGN